MHLSSARDRSAILNRITSVFHGIIEDMSLTSFIMGNFFFASADRVLKSFCSISKSRLSALLFLSAKFWDILHKQ